MKKSSHVIVFLLLFFSRLLTAQDVTLSQGKPSEVGMDEAILRACVQVLQQAVDEDAFRSAVLYTSEERERRRDYYGYGWNVSADGVFSHGGSDGANAWVDPNNKLIVLLFTQSPGEAKLRTRIFRLVQASIR